MRIYRFEFKGETKLGIEQEGVLFALDETDPQELIAKGFRDWSQLPKSQRQSYSFDQVRLLSPVKPGKILCTGINYVSHKQENPKAEFPTEPFFFSKMPSNVIGPDDPIQCPKQSSQVDYEVELAVVIGRHLSQAREEEIEEALFGYTILNDVSARDIQFKDSQITLGKNFDTFCPIGPCIVTRDEISPTEPLSLRTFVNGEKMQSASTKEWIFPLTRLLSFLSGVMTLEPGDVVSTGTPAGVGFFRTPQKFLKPGDIVRLEIDRIGTLENRVV